MWAVKCKSYYYKVLLTASLISGPHLDIVYWLPWLIYLIISHFKAIKYFAKSTHKNLLISKKNPQRCCPTADQKSRPANQESRVITRDLTKTKKKNHSNNLKTHHATW